MPAIACQPLLSFVHQSRRAPHFNPQESRSSPNMSEGKFSCLGSSLAPQSHCPSLSPRSTADLRLSFFRSLAAAPDSKSIAESQQDTGAGITTHELSSGAQQSSAKDGESGVSGLMHKVTEKVSEVGHKLAAKDDE